MFRKTLLAFLALFLILTAASPCLCAARFKKGYLQAMYYWRLPILPDCGTPDVFSCRVPFYIKGRKIVGDVEVVMDLPELAPHPSGPLQTIHYHYTCGACRAEGTLIINSLSGQVITIDGKKMLFFRVEYTEPACRIDCPGTAQDIDCSYEDPVYDEFTTPVKDGYIMERSTNAKLKYAVHLE